MVCKIVSQRKERRVTISAWPKLWVTRFGSYRKIRRILPRLSIVLVFAESEKNSDFDDAMRWVVREKAKSGIKTVTEVLSSH